MGPFDIDVPEHVQVTSQGAYLHALTDEDRRIIKDLAQAIRKLARAMEGQNGAENRNA